MNNQNEKYGLKLFSLKSKVAALGEQNFTVYDSFEKILADNFRMDGYIIVYLDYAVIIREFKKSKIIFMNNEKPFDPVFIQKLRLFNKEKELFIWRTEGKWKARLRIDETGNKEVNVIEIGRAHV